MFEGEIRAIFPDGSDEVLLGPVAIRKAQDMGLDLLLIDPTAKPPLAKATDYGGWQYDRKKDRHEAKRRLRTIQLKELRFRPDNNDHDYEVKKNQAVRFLENGDRVRAVVHFRGRELAHPELGEKLLVRLSEDLRHIAQIEGAPQMRGADICIILRRL